LPNFQTFRVSQHPGAAGRLWAESDPSIRSFAVGSYVIFYRESAKGIEVARVLHGHRDIPAIFRSRATTQMGSVY